LAILSLGTSLSPSFSSLNDDEGPNLILGSVDGMS
jgi:hypothetical protein